MPRKKKVPIPGTRKYGIKSNYTSSALEECLEKVASGVLSAYAASKEYQIPINTIKNKIKGKHTEPVGRPTALTEQEETIITDHIKALADYGVPVGMDDVQQIIKTYLDSNNKKIRVFKNNLPGWEWGQLFLSRHPDLKQTFGHNISRSRAQVDEEKISKFFDNLEVELQDVPPENIYNFDESGFHDDPRKKKMMFRRKCRNPEVIRNSTKSCYTTVFCGNAAGEILPPYFIFKAKHTWSDWLVGAPPGSRMTVTKSGWIDLDSFDDWFKTHFLPAASKKEGKKVLICDNLSSHVSVKTLKLCQENNIQFVCLVPNSTHILQPLDVGFFSALKSNWRTVLLNWRQTTRGKKAISLPKNCFTALVKKTLEMGAQQSSANIMAGFKASGIYPVNREEALGRLAAYARTQVDVPHAIESLGESFINYLTEQRNADLGLKSQRKFQMPVTAGKSVSVEEVEQFYKNKAKGKENLAEPNSSVKRGRPQGSKNKKKMKTQATENVVESHEIISNPTTLNQTTKKTGKKTDKNIINLGASTSKENERKTAKDKEEANPKLTLNMESTIDKIQLESSAPNPIADNINCLQTRFTPDLELHDEVTLGVEEVVMDDSTIGAECVLEDYLVVDGVLEPNNEQNSNPFSAISPGSTVIYREEGCLFPGKVLSLGFPYYNIAAMNRAMDGGWRWPDKREIVKVMYNNIISTVHASKIQIIRPGCYKIEDDLLYMEWGE